MRYLMIAVAATFMVMPAAAPVFACGAKHSAEAVATDFAAKKKPKPKKAKVEYMRAGPMK
jgi:hypothetical protein